MSKSPHSHNHQERGFSRSKDMVSDNIENNNNASKDSSDYPSAVLDKDNISNYTNMRGGRPSPKKKSWKKILGWGALTAVLISVISMGALTQRRTYYSNKFLAESWHTIVTANNNVVSSASLNDINDTKELNKQWAKLNEALDNQKFLLGQINRNFNRAKYFDQYNALLQDLSDATKAEWNINLDSREALYQSLGARSVELKKLNDRSDDFAATYTGIVKEEKLSIYKVAEKLQEKVKAYYLVEDKKTEQQKQEESLKAEQSAQQAAQQAAELLAAKGAVDNFMAALIKNNDTLIMQSLSSGYKKEFNKEYYINSYNPSVASYRIIETKKVDNSDYYKVQASITYNGIDNNTSTNTSSFRVVQESGRWLVDGQAYY